MSRKILFAALSAVGCCFLQINLQLDEYDIPIPNILVRSKGHCCHTYFLACITGFFLVVHAIAKSKG